MSRFFKMNKRLGIQLPHLEREWDEYSYEEQQEILLKWEEIRGHIPDRIYEVEKIINKKQAKLEVEEDFELTCQLNSENADHASVINDLWIWYRTNEDVTDKGHF